MLSQLFLIFGLYFVFGLFEIQFPAERGQRAAGKIRNIFYTLLLFMSGVAAIDLFYLFIPFKVRHLVDHGVAFSIFIVLIYVLLTDLVFYWYHRAEHRFAFMWAVHELHHSDTELNATTGMRSYWLERPIQTLLISLPISFVIGIDSRAVIILPFVLTVWLFFTHANWKLRLGFLTPVLCGPQVHRIHHSDRPEHQGKNMAQFFPFIDIAFGTYHAPRRDEFPTTGIPELATDAPISKVIMRPWKAWAKSLARFFGMK